MAAADAIGASLNALQRSVVSFLRTRGDHGATDEEIAVLMEDPGIIRNRLKLKAVRQNAQAWLKLEDPVALLWSFVGGTPKINHFSERSQVPALTPEAEAMSKALKKAGFTFVGPTICYAFMQATGMVMDHTTDCDRYAQLKGS
jgi:DNA-3-methyladenine glycosylase I